MTAPGSVVSPMPEDESKKGQFSPESSALSQQVQELKQYGAAIRAAWTDRENPENLAKGPNTTLTALDTILGIYHKMLAKPEEGATDSMYRGMMWFQMLTHELGKSINIISIKRDVLKISGNLLVNDTDRILVNAINNLAALLDNIEIFAEAGKDLGPDSPRRNIDLTSTVRQFFANNPNYRPNYRLDLPDGIPEIAFHPQALDVILGELMVNNQKYGGGKANVSIRMSTIEHFPGVILTFQDFGAGVPDEEIPYLTVLNRRAQTHIDQGIEGTGVGLFMVNQLMKKYYGYFEIHSNRRLILQPGLTFELYFRLAKRK